MEFLQPQIDQGVLRGGVAIQYLDPISNVNTLWSTNDYTGIDDGIRQPNTGFSGSCIANKNDDSEGQQWGAELGIAGTYSSLKLWAYGYRGGTAGQPSGRLNVNGSWEDSQDFSLGLGAGSPSWSSLTFTGPFTLPLSSLTIEIASPNMPGGTDAIVIQAAYVEAVP